ncbi:MAG: hypothetical protein JWP63_4953, partial [Candidatus Solibacter sp.]|nr:hypothetical protein [Candidatus Solibacter sp.]
VIVDVGAVGGADFDEGGAGAGHDVGDAESVADLDEFAAGDNGLGAGGEFVKREEERGGVVVDGDGGRAEDALEEVCGVDVALAASSGGEIVFEIGISGEHGERAERSASEISVEDDAGGVDDVAERGALERGERGFDASVGGGSVGAAGEDFGAHVIECAADFFDDERAGIAGERGGELIEDVVDGW